MRLVQWSPQERADQPDLTAMSFLVLGDLRRHVRGMLVGADEGRFIRGFAVEPAAAPDTTIRVRLDIGGTLGFLIGAENMGARRDWGQLIGGDDTAGNLEGNASATLDFAGQPANTYRVQIRFVYSAGANDNRAFWNPGGNTEFIAATDTRWLPAWEIRYSGAASPEWIDIADVVWDGVGPIGAGQITDLRSFAVECTAPFSRATQDAAGGIDDFDRSTDRGATAVGLNAIYPALRALARQIQDLKGPSAAGLWDWFSRPFPVPGTTVPVDAELTKNLRSIDVVTFTVGDGTSEWGDFNGLDGLDDCLAHIDANEATLPTRVRIILKTRAVAGPVFTIATARTIAKSIEIIGVAGSSAGSYGRIQISCSHGVGAMLTIPSGSHQLYLENIDITTTAADTSIFSLSPTGTSFVAKNCRLAGLTATGTAGFAFVCSTSKLHLERCTIAGRVMIHDDDADHESADGGVITACAFSSAAIMLHGPNVNDRCTAGLLIERCSILNSSTTVYANSPYGLIDGRGAANVEMRGCRLSWGTLDWDCVHLGHLDTVTPDYPSKKWLITKCHFDAPTSRSHGVDGGNNGARGTGWHVFVNSTSASTEQFEDIDIVDNVFDGNSEITSVQIDAGAIYLLGVDRCTVRGNRIENLGAAAGGRVDAIRVFASDYVEIENNQIHRWSVTIVGDTAYGIRLETVTHSKIRGNTLDGRAYTGVSITGLGASSSMLLMNGVDYSVITDNIFEQVNRDDATSHVINCTSSNVRWCTFRGNIFDRCGGNVISATTAGAFEHNLISENIVHRAAGEDGAGFSTSAAGTADHNNWIGNIFHFEDDSAVNAISTGAMTEQVYIGNNCIPDGINFFGNIDQIGGPTTNSVGFNPVTALNNADYT